MGSPSTHTKRSSKAASSSVGAPTTKGRKATSPSVGAPTTKGRKATSPSVGAPTTKGRKATSPSVGAPTTKGRKATSPSVGAPTTKGRKATSPSVGAPTTKARKAASSSVGAPTTKGRKATSPPVSAWSNSNQAHSSKRSRPRLNAPWHRAHRMPPNATLPQRLAWPQAHELHCACRPMPANLRAMLETSPGARDRNKSPSPIGPTQTGTPRRSTSSVRRYVAFLRGVSPMNLRMADLKRCLEDEGFKDVRTLLSSGNVVFSVDNVPGRALEDRIESSLRRRLGREFPT